MLNNNITFNVIYSGICMLKCRIFISNVPYQILNMSTSMIGVENSKKEWNFFFTHTLLVLFCIFNYSRK